MNRMQSGAAQSVLLLLVVFIGMSQAALAARCFLCLRRLRRKAAARAGVSFHPSVALICPCKGLDTNLAGNIRAISELDYPCYTVIFVVASAKDEALPALETLVSSHPRTRLIIAPPARGRGEKVNNLIAAADTPEARAADVLAFIDSDVQPKAGWLDYLVRPLSEAGVGLTTSYRRYLVRRGQFWSNMRAVGNNVAMAPYMVGDNLDAAWGGAMAVRRTDFDRSGAVALWRTAVDDDLTLAQAVRSLGLRIEYVHECLSTCIDRCTARQYYDWLTRQSFLVRVYNPRMWRLAWFSFVPMTLMVAAMVLGASAFLFPALRAAALILALVIPLQLAGGILTALVFRDFQTAAWVPPGLIFSGSLSAAAFVASAFIQRITWRGVTYEVRSATEVVVID